MSHFQLDDLQISSYRKDGYVIVKNFLKQEEISKLYAIATADTNLLKHAFDLNDQSGKKTKLTLDFYLGKNIVNEIKFRLLKQKKMEDSFSRSLVNLGELVKEIKLPLVES